MCNTQSTPIQGTSGKETVTNDLVVCINLIKWCTHVQVMYVCPHWISHIKQCCIVSLLLICIINKAVRKQFSIFGPTLRALFCIGEIQGWISLKTTVCGGGRGLCTVNGKACGRYSHQSHTHTCYTGTHKCMNLHAHIYIQRIRISNYVYNLGTDSYFSAMDTDKSWRSSYDTLAV